MEKNYLKVLYELYNKEDLTQKDIFDALTYSERSRLFVFERIGHYAVHDFIRLCNKKGIYLFTDKEFKDLSDFSNLIFPDILIPKEIFLSSINRSKEDNHSLYQIANNVNLGKLSDDEIATIIESHPKINNQILESSMMLEFSKKLKSDELKDQYFKKFYDIKENRKRMDEFAFAEAIASFESDDFKKKWLRKVPDDERCDVVKTFKDDHQKLIYSLSYNGINKKKILASIKDQDLVRKALRNPVIDKFILICLEDEKEREMYFRRFHTMISGEDKGLIIASFSTREKQLELLPFLRTEKSRDSFLTKTRLLTDGDKWRIVKNYKTSKRQVDATDYISDMRIQNDIFANVTSVELIREFIHRVKDDKLFAILVDRMSEHQIKKAIEEERITEPKLLLIALERVKDKKWVMKKMREMTLKSYNVGSLDYFVQMYAKKYKLNEEHLKKFADTFGYGVFKYIESERVREAINLGEEDFQKYMRIFGNKNLVANDITVKNLLFGIAQEEYRSKNDDIIHMLPYVMQALDADDFESARLIMRPLFSKHYEDFAEKLGISKSSSRKAVSTLLLKRLKENDPTIMHYFEEVVDKFINEHHAKETANIAKSYLYQLPTKATPKAIENVFTYSFSANKVRAYVRPYYAYLSDEEKFLINSDILGKILEFKRNPKGVQVDDNFKHQLNIYSSMIKKLIDHGLGTNPEIMSILSVTGANKEIIYDGGYFKEQLFAILQEVNPKQLVETVFNDPKKYKELLAFLEKNKILGASLVSLDVASQAQVPLDEGLLASLINNYPIISEKLAKKSGRVGMMDYMEEADYYNSESYRYQNLFSKDVYRLIKNDPIPNKSKYNRSERVKMVPKYVREMYKRTKVAVPPQEADYKTSSGKVLNVKLGDIHSVHNLALGELTGACMRVGGVGESLFKFCLLNENGFHMTFTNPRNGKIISRVSGLRNGNTVFFNELRYSLDPDYKDEDIYEVFKQAAQKIIEDAKDSPMPIDNVVVSDHLIMGYFDEPTNLGVNNIRKGLPYVYTNINGSNAVVVATTAKNSKYAPVKLNPNCPKYDGLRSKPKYYGGIDAKHEVDHLNTLRLFLYGSELDEIDIPKEAVESCYSTSHWGVYIKKDGSIGTIAVQNDKETLTEIKNFVEELQKRLQYEKKGTNSEVASDAKSR